MKSAAIGSEHRSNHSRLSGGKDHVEAPDLRRDRRFLCGADRQRSAGQRKNHGKPHRCNQRALNIKRANQGLAPL